MSHDADGLRAKPSLMVRHETWPVGGDSIPKLSLHVHGDDDARAHASELAEAVESLRAHDTPLTLAALDKAVRGVAARFGLTGVATKARCMEDPLETVVDVSFYSSREETS